MSSIVNKLRALLVGKTIAAIESPNATEAICRFEMTDGTSFRLHATDLGAWIEKATRIGEPHKSLFGEAGIFSEYAHHVYYHDNREPKGVDITADKVTIIAQDGRAFTAKREDLTEDENKIVAHPEAARLLIEAADCGKAAEIVFSEDSYGCPPELQGLCQPPRLTKED